MDKRVPCTAGLPLLQFQQFHAAKQTPMQESQQALLDMEVSHSWPAELTGRSSHKHCSVCGRPVYWLAALTLRLFDNIAFVQLRAELVSTLAPMHGTLGPGGLGPRLVDLLLQCAAFAKPLLCALYFVPGQ